MQDLDEMPSGPRQAGIEVGRRADILRMAVKCDSTLAQLADDRLGIVLGRGVVHHLDLHLLGPWVLGEHALQGLAEPDRAVVGRDHHRPGGAVHPVGHGLDLGIAQLPKLIKHRFGLLGGWRRHRSRP